MVDRPRLNRDQIARFVGNDPAAIRAIERLFVTAENETPAEVAALTNRVDAAELAVGVSDNKGETALWLSHDALSQISDAAKMPASEARGDVNYIDFNVSPHVSRIRRMAWNDTAKTLDLGMDYDVVQQIGLEQYARVENQTGSLLPNGTVVGFVGPGPGNAISVAPYVADGSDPAFYVIGMMTHDLPDSGEVGYATTFGKVRGIDTSAYSDGDVIYADPDVPGGLTNVKPTAPDNVVLIGFVITSDATDGEIFVRPIIEQQEYYAVAIKTADQSPPAINTEYQVTFDSLQISNGITIGSPTSRLVVPNAGLYHVEVKLQLQSNSTAQKDFYLWFKVNGSAIANSTRVVTTNLNGGYVAFSAMETISLQENDYVELAFAADDTDVTIKAVPATAFAPATAAVLLSITQVHQ
jgi:hypothetical protein